ncbi:MAG: peptidoglycan bridge formation glycyltransferase FemA/FemB family protein [Ignavibacteriales bacterium]|nr:peptidoglycan bridge formation glycyltransferase FemA/FemB family protein [Ignavibacteriales bacterium]
MKVAFIASGNAKTKSGLSQIVINQGLSLEKINITVDYFGIKGKGILGYLKNILAVRDFLKKNNVDVIHSHYSLSSFIVSISKIGLNIPQVASLMGSDIHTNAVMKFIIKVFSNFIWKNTIVKSVEMKKRLDLKNSIVIANGVDLDFFFPDEQQKYKKKINFDKNKKQIIWVSNPDRYEKNFTLAEKAVESLNNRDIQLVVVSDKPLNVVKDYMLAADMLLLSSLWEGSPNVIKEAMALNLPIVSTDVGDVRDIISDTVGCFVVLPNIDAMAKAIEKCLDFGRRTNGRKAITHLDSNIVAQKIFSIYEALIQKDSIRVEQESNKIKATEWEDLIQGNCTSNVFHTPNMYMFWLKQEKITPKIFAGYVDEKLVFIMLAVMIKENGKIKGFLSRRSVIYGGPIIDNSLKKNKVAFTRILAQINDVLKKRSIYSEIRNFNDYSEFQDIFVNSGWNYKTHLNFHVDCSDIVQAKKRISKSKIRQINNSLKAGAEIIQAANENEITEFYAILGNLYKSKVKKPLYPLDFFIDFFKSDLGVYLLIKYNNKIIGGIMCPIYRNLVIYEWFVCGEDGVYKNIYPSILATWAAIKYACDNGIKRFDFMGAGKPNEDYGVRDFKSKFGGDLVEYGRFLRIDNKFLYTIGKIGLKLNQMVK